MSAHLTFWQKWFCKKQQPEKFISFLLGTIVLPVALAVALVGVALMRVDAAFTPDDIAKIQHNRSDFAWRGPQRLYAAIKLARLQLEKPEIAIIGSSRVGQIRCAIFKPYSCYNATMIGWNLERMGKVMQIVGGDHPPKIVVMNVDFLMFNSGFQEHWSGPENKMPLAYTRQQVAIAALKNVITTWNEDPSKVLHQFMDGKRGTDDDYTVFGPTLWDENNTLIRSDGSLTFTHMADYRSRTDYLRSIGADPDFFTIDMDDFLRGNRSLIPRDHTVTVMLSEHSLAGHGQHIDPNAMAQLVNIAHIAQQRGITLVAVQLPYLRKIVHVLDAGKDFYEEGRSFMGADSGVWKEFESPKTAEQLTDMGLLFFDFSRMAEHESLSCFLDGQHPSEYMDLTALLAVLKDPRLRTLLPDIDLRKLEDIREQAITEKNCFDIFREHAFMPKP